MLYGIVYIDSNKNFIGHGFLVVDFFFCLSGFVIDYAYDDRMLKWEFYKFFVSRIFRLYPFVIAGSTIKFLIHFLCFKSKKN
ncbi:hypothetical protein FLGSB24_04340 [Flavobacterium sp. GSB-24]|nr:hypothetical protein FLGSB24_04340 [Flavobacterium sp. GSB-24]